MGARDSPHRPLLLVLLGPLLEQYFDAGSVEFVLGGHRGSYWLLSDISGLVSCWLVFLLAVFIFYKVVPPAIDAWAKRRYPNSPTALVSPALIGNMKEVAQAAFPLYATMPVLTDFFQKKGWAATCDGVEDCGGSARTVLACVAYFAIVEVLIFIDHYYLLHKWSVASLTQAYHHVQVRRPAEAAKGTPFARDGWSQGMPLALCTLFVPVRSPSSSRWRSSPAWTSTSATFAHCRGAYGALHHPPPVQLVQLWLHDRHDGHPLPHGQAPQGRRRRQVEVAPMPSRRRSPGSRAILEKRGMSALQRDDAAGDATSQHPKSS